MNTIKPLGIRCDQNGFELLAIAREHLQESDKFIESAGCYAPNVTMEDAALAESVAEVMLVDSIAGLQAIGHLIRHHDGHDIEGTDKVLSQVGCLASLLADMQQYALDALGAAQARCWAHERIAASRNRSNPIPQN